MTKRHLNRIAIFVAMIGSATVAIAAPRSAVQRDVESYAMASCFTALDDPFLKRQGDLWAGGIVQRGKGSIETFRRVADAVRREMATAKVPIAHGDGGPQGDVPVPLLYCVEMIDAARVRAAIDRAITQLTPAYRRR